MKFIQFKPLIQERVWGGRGLENELGIPLEEGKVYGESWEIVDREEANSEISNGDQYKTLGELRKNNTAYLMGPNWESEKPFPILVKWLDCEERLSLQVHPPAEIAPKLGGEPKTENWYIAKSKPGAGLLAGLKSGVTKEQFAEGLKKNELEPLVHRIEVEAGNSLFVPSGRIHAIDAGNLILEIQQNSDTTYRVYDWGRVGLDGKPRQLHIKESMESIDFEDYEPNVLSASGSDVLLADSEEFRLRKLKLKGGDILRFGENEEPRILSIVSGLLEEGSGSRIKAGANVILPYGESSEWQSQEDTELLITDRFSL